MKKRRARSKLHKALKHHFVPHAGNDYHPHILHTKRAIFYAAFLLGIKVFVIGFGMALPMAAYLAPNVLAAQEAKLMNLTNNLRAEKGLPKLAPSAPLKASAEDKAADMIALGYFSHQGPQGHDLSYFLGLAGYKYSTAGENLAMGFSDAESVMDGWIKSPTHYANLVDPDYQQFGMGVQEGLYDGKDTVFVAQHFGVPLESEAALAVAPTTRVAAAPSSVGMARIATNKPSAPAAVQKSVPAPAPTPKPIPTPVPAPAPAPAPVLISPPPAQIALVAPTPQAAPSTAITFDASNSFVRWVDIGGGSTQLLVQVVASGPISLASASVEGYPIELKPQPGVNNAYVGTLTIPEASQTLFRTVIPPSATLIGQNGVVLHESVDWEHPQIVSPTPWQKYTQARDWFSVVPSVFSVSHWVYFAFMLFFASVLGFGIVVEARFLKHKRHIIMQTLALLLVIFVMWKT